MSLLYYRGIQLQVCRFLDGCERRPINACLTTAGSVTVP
jgi:hypothetical protein